MSDSLFSRSAEEALVGSALIAPDTVAQVDIVSDEFFIQRLGWVWQAIKDMSSAGEVTDVITVGDELKRRDQLAEAGGIPWLIGLINNTGSYLHIQEYAETVRDYARRRAWVRAATEMVKAANDTDTPLSEHSSQVIEVVTRLSAPRSGARHISEWLPDLVDEVCERMSDPKEVWGIPTGFLDYDRLTGGLHPSELVNVAGMPGVGKSILAHQAAYEMAGAGRAGALYSLEMPTVQSLRRELSAAADVRTVKFKTGHVNDAEYERFAHQVGVHERIPLYISDEVYMDTGALRADLARLKALHGIEWFVLDYAYLLTDGAGMSETERTTIISRSLKAICRSLRLAGVVIQSLNKAGMNGEIGGKHLRGSGQQYYDADVILILTQDPDNNKLVNCKLEKGRELERQGAEFPLLRADKRPKFLNVEVRKVNINQAHNDAWSNRKDLT